MGLVDRPGYDEELVLTYQHRSYDREIEFESGDNNLLDNSCPNQTVAILVTTLATPRARGPHVVRSVMLNRFFP